MNQDQHVPVAIVTGGSTGIGLSTVTTLLSAGYRVAFFSQNAHHLDQAKKILRAAADQSQILSGCVDVRSQPSVDSFFADVEKRWGVIDALVCNAGISPKGIHGAVPFEDVEASEWQDVLSVNLTGAVWCCQAALRRMKPRGRGRIVLIGSVAGRTIPKIAGPPYVASKAAIAGLARSMVATCSGTAITINVVAPGRIATDMAGDPTSSANVEALRRIPVGRLGTGADVATLIRFLVSEDAGFINGAIIDVNGGEFAPL